MRLFVVLLLVGCTAPDDAENDGTDPGAPGAQICPDWSGFTAEGQTWSYESIGLSPRELGYLRSDYTLVELSETAVVVESEVLANTSESENYTATSTATWSCDADGLWLDAIRWDTAYDSSTDGQRYVGWIEVIYDQYLWMPADIGDGWSVRATWVETDDRGDRTEGEIDGAWSVGVTSKLKVPAGRFDVKQFTFEGVGDDARGSWWGNSDVGMVKSGGQELVERGR